MGVNLDPTDKVFFFADSGSPGGPVENPVDDIASPSGILSNMLLKAAITKISFF